MRILLLVVSFGIAASASAQPDPGSIVERSEQLMQGDTQEGTYEMTIVRPDWERSTRFEFWSRGDDLAFIRVLDPAKDRGVAFLKRGREMWQYVPRIDRTIKIPPSMMLQSWMGSDFTNDDLVRESSISEDYAAELLGTDSLDAGPAYRIGLTPKPSAPVTWGRIVEWIRVDDYVPLRAEYFNERGDHIRTMRFEDIRQADDRTIPMRMIVIEEDEPGHRTVLQLEEVEFNERIPESVFSQQNLRRGR